MTSAADQEPESQRPSTARRLALAAPLLLFALLVVLFQFGLSTSDYRTELPSALINKPVPEFDLPPVPGMEKDGKPSRGFTSKDLADGHVTLVNVWASWCGPCKYEHPLLAPLKARAGVRLYGVNYKDKPEAAVRMLSKGGNPFDAVGADESGRVSIEWGVTGVPETFVIDGAGRIVSKLSGPITEENIESRLMPAINKARAATKG